jgi:hypothetical protein
MMFQSERIFETDLGGGDVVDPITWQSREQTMASNAI